jgi:CubicO group peptidase (beta-lactamase class C family)
MKTLIFIVPCLLFSLLWGCSKDEPVDEMETESTYFPPKNSSEWATISPESLEWNMAALNDLETFVDDADTRALLIIKNGKIAYEHYNGKGLLGGDFSGISSWYWASAGKTLTSFIIGKAQEEGFLNIDDRSSDYLEERWTSLPKTREDLITIRNQLTMTSGLSDLVNNSDCTDPECLKYLTDPNTRWAYHNAPYSLLDGVIEGTTDLDFDAYFSSRLKDQIGMDGLWSYLDFNHVYFSTARSMARFGLLILNQGKWGEEVIIEKEGYFEDMTNTSQDINLSYGYLWWLNGKSSFKTPIVQNTFSGSITPNAPDDMYSALGKNGQFLCIVPSQNLILIRMGNNPDQSLVPINFLNQLWEKLNLVIAS